MPPWMMGLATPALRFLIREHKRQPFTGSLLTLGRQGIYATHAEVRRLLRSEGIRAFRLPADIATTTNIPAWQAGPQQRFTNDTAFFYALTGQRMATLDVSDYEGADYIWDLNLPVPPVWEHQFDLILDFGTLEHIFDTKQALWNINRMLRPDGRIIHMLPASNYVEHGFYSFSPTLFYDYYSLNRFTNLRAYLAEQAPWHIDSGPWKFWQWREGRPEATITSPRSLIVFFSAQKELTSTVEKVPQQGYSSRQTEGGRTGKQKHSGWQAKLYAYLPRWLLIMGKRLLGRDLTIRPWGLRSIGKL